MTFSDDKLYLSIIYDDCDGTGRIYFTRKIGKDGKPDRSDRVNHASDFQSECLLKDNSSMLSCHVKGHTPLAGATYKLKQVGTYKLDCGMLEGNPKQPHMRYVCISGCSESAPKYLDKKDPCD
jgi:hypothetical protein